MVKNGQKLNFTKTEMSYKLKCHQDWNVPKTEVSPKPKNVLELKIKIQRLALIALALFLFIFYLNFFVFNVKLWDIVVM